jgi:hypothetical protein
VLAAAAPLVSLDKRYKLVDDFETLIPHGAPSLVKCTKLTVKGPVAFGKGLSVTGEVEVANASGDVKVVDRDLANEQVAL